MHYKTLTMGLGLALVAMLTAPSDAFALKVVVIKLGGSGGVVSGGGSGGGVSGGGSGGGGGGGGGVVTDPLTVTGPSSAATEVGEQLVLNFDADGGVPPYTWSVDGASFLNIDSSSGEVTGVATAEGTWNAVVTVEDSDSNVAETNVLIQAVETFDPLQLTTTKLNRAYVGEEYYSQVDVAGGKYPYTFTASGLPVSMSMDSSTGLISGTPDEIEEGTYVVTVWVNDSNDPVDSTTFKYSLMVSAVPEETVELGGTLLLAAATAGEAYSQTFGTTGGGSSLTWTVTGLPTGLAATTSSEGDLTIAGSTLEGQEGTYYVKLVATDENGDSDSALVQLQVNKSSSTSSGGSNASASKEDLVGASGCSLSGNNNMTGVLIGLMLLLGGACVMRRGNKGLVYERN